MWFVFGIGVIVFFFFVWITYLIICLPDPDRKSMHFLISFWAKFSLLICPMLKIKMTGGKNLDPKRTYIFVVNHQSLSDILVVLYLQYPFKFMAKKELFSIPFFGWGMELTGYIPLVRGNRESGKHALDLAKAYLSRGMSVLMFPEGTRSPDGTIKNFKRGAFRLSVELGIPVVPIVLDGTKDLISKGKHLIPRKRVPVEAVVGEPCEPPKITREVHEIDIFMGEIRSRMIEALHQMRENRKRAPSP